MMFANEPTIIVENANATPTPTPRPTPPAAEPQNGVTSAPEGALEPALQCRHVCSRGLPFARQGVYGRGYDRV